MTKQDDSPPITLTRRACLQLAGATTLAGCSAPQLLDVGAGDARTDGGLFDGSGRDAGRDGGPGDHALDGSTDSMPDGTTDAEAEVADASPEDAADVGDEDARFEDAGQPDAGLGAALTNVLFISIDDLNDWVGFLGGHPQTLTPNLDAFAATGVVFSNAHCAAPACNPSRSATLLGMRPHRTGIYLNNQPWRPVPSMSNLQTLPQAFGAGGFHTARAGKVFHQTYWKNQAYTDGGDPQSWQEHFPRLCKSRPNDPRPPANLRPLNALVGESNNFDWGPISNPASDMADYQVATAVEGMLQRNHAAPFFIGCGFFRPHLEFYAPQAYFNRMPRENQIVLPSILANDHDDIPPRGTSRANIARHNNVVNNNQWRAAVRAYLACIHFVDEQFGRVIQALDASPYANNTAVVLWSDHGWHLGEKLHWNKFSLWEEATRVPLVIRAPTVTPSSGGVCSRPVSLQDLFPTLADLFGLSPTTTLDGHSLRPLLRNPRASWGHAALTTWYRNNHSVRDERYRYTRYANGEEELYDHTGGISRPPDPNEYINLASHPGMMGVKANLRQHLPITNAENIARDRDYSLSEILGFRCQEPS